MSAKKKIAPASKKSIYSDPGLVAHCIRYEPFNFPGTATPPPPAMPVPALVETIKNRADTINRQRFEGHSEVFALFLVNDLLNWLASRAHEGSLHAQTAIADVAGNAVDFHSWSLLQGHEPTLSRARKRPSIPGNISLNPELTAHWQAILKEVGQGTETPVPMERRHGKKVSTRDISRGNHRLVSALFDYISSYRNHGIIKAMKIPHDHPELHDRIKEMLALKGLEDEPKIVTEWHKVGYKIVMDWTNKSPELHEAFNRPPLNEMYRPQTRSSISADLRTAWKKLASEMST